MSDADLRALERRWLDSCAVEDEARWHAARLRAGLVTENGLVIAAGLGHEAATRLAPAVGLAPLELLDRPELPPRNPKDSPRIRAAIGLARAMSRLHIELLPPPSSVPSRRPAEEHVPALEAGLAAAEGWARCPCPEHVAGLACLASFHLNDCIPDCCWYDADFPGQLVGLALDVIAVSASRPPRGGWHFPDLASMFAPDARRTMMAQGLPHDLQGAAEEAIRAAVLPWALGLSDPLLDPP